MLRAPVLYAASAHARAQRQLVRGAIGAMHYHAVIVGGGLGGSVLAEQLARAGHRVLVLERETQFKDRVRGENFLSWGYACEHDRYYDALHRIHTWMTELAWTTGPDAHARRERVMPKWIAQVEGFPDLVGLGPFGPSDERARRIVLGLD